MFEDIVDDDVSLMSTSGKDHTGKGSFYNPSIKHKCRQLVCSVRAAIIISVCAALFILTIALIAAFARPQSTCSCNKPTESTPIKVAPTEAKATTGERFPYENIRLPKSVAPELYDIFMHPNLTTFTFKGRVNITLRVIKPTDYIVLHSDHLKLTNQWLKCGEKRVEIVKFLEYEAHSQLYIKLGEQLKAGSTCMLHLEFKANLSDALHGFYKSSYKDQAGNIRYLATTHFEATHARSAFPCFDEPQMKANFTMSMVREKDYISLFNMPHNSEGEPYSDGLFLDIFDTSVKMSTYLVAFVVCDYANRTGYTKERHTRVSVFAPPHQIEEAEFARDAAVKILDHYENFFGVPYPLPKQDLIAIPDFSAGAMENWGLITYRMTSILYNPKVSSSGNKQWVAIVVAHELAHQWFGNLVTMKWWNDLWLNEGFASFTEYIGADYVEKDWNLMDQFLVETLQSALGSDSLQNSHPISVPVHDPAEINEIFDSISYDKGSSLIRMIEGFVGREVLQKGLKRYLTKFQFKNAETDDLWESLSIEANITGPPVNVKAVMDTWTLQMGYPVVSLKWDRDTNRVTASQQRFLLFPNSTPSTEFTSNYGYKWHIPLSYRTNQSPEQTLKWMHMNSVSFNIPGGSSWLKANINMKGFYRVLYDEQNWQALTLELKSNINVLPAADRASLLDDAFSLARAGMLKLKIALDLSEYLIKEQDYIPWSVGLGNLHYIGKLLEGKPEHEYYEKYSLYLMQHVISSIGWKDEGGQLQKYLRALMLGGASRLGDKATINKTREIFNDWMNHGVEVPVNLKNVVYGGGVQHGGEKAWDFTWKKYNEARVPSEKKKLLIALARSTDADVINRYLQWSLDDKKVRSQDTVSVVTRLAGNGAAGRILAWHFIRANWDTMYDRYGQTAFAMKSLINGVVTGFTNEFDRTEVERFFKNAPVGSGKRAVHQALEAIQMNIDWLKQYETQVTTWLTNKVQELQL